MVPGVAGSSPVYHPTRENARVVAGSGFFVSGRSEDGVVLKRRMEGGPWDLRRLTLEGGLSMGLGDESDRERV